MAGNKYTRASKVNGNPAGLNKPPSRQARSSSVSSNNLNQLKNASSPFLQFGESKFLNLIRLLTFSSCQITDQTVTQDVASKYKSKIKTPAYSLNKDIALARLLQLSSMIARRKESESELKFCGALKSHRLSLLSRPFKKFLYHNILNLFLLESDAESTLIALGGLIIDYEFIQLKF